MRYLAAGIALVCTFSSSACPTLEGAWTSSKEAFIQFNQRWANIDADAWQFMLQNQGLETLMFSATGDMLITTPETELTMAGKTVVQEATLEQSAYSVLGCAEQSVVIEYQRYGEKRISTFQFDTADTMWEYAGQPGKSGNGHIREFFIRD